VGLSPCVLLPQGGGPFLFWGHLLVTLDGALGLGYRALGQGGRQLPADARYGWEGPVSWVHWHVSAVVGRADLTVDTWCSELGRSL